VSDQGSSKVAAENSGLLQGSRRALKAGLIRVGVLRLAQGLVKRRIAILRYHSLRKEPGRFAHSIGSGIIHTPEVFARQMELVARKYDPVSLDDVALFLQGGKDLARRPVAVTFDDGFSDNHEIAAPLMERYGIRGTFYVTVSAIENPRPPWFCRLRHAFGRTDRPEFAIPGAGPCYRLDDREARRAAFLAASAACARTCGATQEQTIQAVEEALEVAPLANEGLMMSWDQIRALDRTGHIVGSHTLSHPNMAQISESDAEHELRESRAILENQLGKEVRHFAYPNPILTPHWTTHTCEIAAGVGYHTSVTSQSGAVAVGVNPLATPRISVPHSEAEFRWVLGSTLLGRVL